MSSHHYIPHALVMCLIWVLPICAANDKKPRWYDVEVIVFENLDVPSSPNLYSSEQGYMQNKRGALVGDRGLYPIKNLQLTKEAQHIKRSTDYRFLVHQAWRQTGQPLNQSQAVQIQNGERIPVAVVSHGKSSDVTVIGDDQIDSLLELNSIDSNTEKVWLDSKKVTEVEGYTPVFPLASEKSTQKPETNFIYPLEGTITIALRRYLHIYTNLSLTKSIVGDSDGHAKEKLRTNFLKSHRRVRSREIHYIDSPKLGMLILITPR